MPLFEIDGDRLFFYLLPHCLNAHTVDDVPPLCQALESPTGSQTWVVDVPVVGVPTLEPSSAASLGAHHQGEGSKAESLKLEPGTALDSGSPK